MKRQSARIRARTEFEAYQPHSFDDDMVPYYTSEQYSLYGPPEHWPNPQPWYHIIELRETSAPLVLDWDMEQLAKTISRPIHRYNRVARFKTTLAQISGITGSVPREIICQIITHLNSTGPKRIWNNIRHILKTLKLQKYYNQIPFIIQQLSFGHTTQISAIKFSDIMNQFRHINHAFQSTPNRKYFPNLRYMALKLLALNNITTTYTIPLLRTARRINALDIIWGNLTKNLNFKDANQ
jgi:hypothetical protein